MAKLGEMFRWDLCFLFLLLEILVDVWEIVPSVDLAFVVVSFLDLDWLRR